MENSHLLSAQVLRKEKRRGEKRMETKGMKEKNEEGNSWWSKKGRKEEIQGRER